MDMDVIIKMFDRMEEKMNGSSDIKCNASTQTDFKYNEEEPYSYATSATHVIQDESKVSYASVVKNGISNLKIDSVKNADKNMKLRQNLMYYSLVTQYCTIATSKQHQL